MAQRAGHTANRLPDGRLLIVGGIGEDAEPLEDSVALLDPTSLSWSAVPTAALVRYDHRGISLPEGGVLIVGGCDSLAWCETTAPEVLRYDLATSRWRPAGVLQAGRHSHQAVLLSDGRILVTGGVDEHGVATTSVEIVDPETGTVTETAPMGERRSDHTATSLEGGRVLVTGGGVGQRDSATAEVYDPSTGSWSPAASMHRVRALHRAALLPDGRVLVTGGGASDGSVEPAAEIWTPGEDRWQALAGGPNRIGFELAALPDGRVLLVGGEEDGRRLAVVRRQLGAHHTERPHDPRGVPDAKDRPAQLAVLELRSWTRPPAECAQRHADEPPQS